MNLPMLRHHLESLLKTSRCEDSLQHFTITHPRYLRKHLSDILALCVASWNGRTMEMCRSCSTARYYVLHEMDPSSNEQQVGGADDDQETEDHGQLRMEWL